MSTRTRLLITLVALGLIAIHRYEPKLGVGDKTELVLLVLALVPWAGALLKSVDIPGVGKFELQELKKRVDENKGAVQSLERRADAALPVLLTHAGNATDTSQSAIDLLTALSRQYVVVRKKLAPGKDRSAQMGLIFGQMVTVSGQIGDFPVQKYLTSNDAGERLAAYAFLIAKPRALALEQLVATITSGLEDQPFGQYWGLRGLARILETSDVQAVSSSVKQQLSLYCKGLKRDTDRHFELSKIAETLGFEC